jgi:hypothetical protein
MVIPVPAQFRKRRARRKPPRSAPTPPANPVYIQRVLAGGETADWIFDAELMYVNDISPLKINGHSPTGIDFAEDNILRVTYAIFIDIGMPWTYDGTPVAQFVADGTLQPGSGTTEEG